MSDLLPPAASVLERNAAEVLGAAVALPAPIRDLWNPATCPAALLPYLAWARSVDRWDAAWSETVKRGVIAASWNVHKHKGTIAALRRVVEPLGFLIEVQEWWEEVPPATPGTFKLLIGVLDTGITDEMYGELERLIDDAKPLTRHLTGLAISLESSGLVCVGCLAYMGDELTVYPWTGEDLVIAATASFVGALHLIDTLQINPEA